MRNNYYILIAFCHYFIIEWFQSVPLISTAFRIGEQSILNGFLLHFKIITKPFN